MKRQNNNIEELIKEIADWCVDEGTTRSSTGSWIIYACDIQKNFDISTKLLNENANHIASNIDSLGDTMREEILDPTEITFDDDGNFESFDMCLSGEAICRKCHFPNSFFCSFCDVRR